jgi:hypothetical protein
MLMIIEELIAKLSAHQEAEEQRRAVERRERAALLAPIVADLRAELALPTRWQNFVVVGRLLLKAKGIVPHGEWQMWLEEIGVPYYHAVKCIKRAKEKRAVAQRWALKDVAE